MVTAGIGFYDIVLWLHITSAVVGFGATFAYPFIYSIAQSRFPRSVPAAITIQLTIDRKLVTPLVFLLLATGIFLVADGPYGFEEGWINAALTLLIVLILVALLYFGPRGERLLELAERDIKASGEGEVVFSEEYDALTRQLNTVGGIAGLTVIFVVFLMATKPF